MRSVRLSAFAVVASVACAVPALLTAAPGPVQTEFRPGELWGDTNGNHINAHGGGILRHGGRWYWFGDRWTPANAIDGRYIWLPIVWEDGKPTLPWTSSWSY